jgi:hypothetical protein
MATPAANTVATEPQTRLDFWRNVCGCNVGALVALATLAWYISQDHGDVSTLGAVLRGAAIVVAAGLLGKLVTIALARAVVKVLR